MLGNDALAQVRTHWRARLAAVGVPLGVLERLLAASDTWEAWARNWEAEAVQEEERAKALAASGLLVSAGEAYALAALLFHFGQLILFHDPATKDRLSRRREEAFRAGAGFLQPPARVFSVPSPSGAPLHAYLRLPRNASGKVPCVLVVPGADSVKEENLAFTTLLVDRGMAAVAFDGPGQGETRQGLAFAEDYERHITPLIRHVAGLPEIDAGRLGLAGFSFGGYLAPRVAAAHPEIGACVILGGCYDFSYWDTMPPLLKEDFAYVFGVSTWEEAAGHARRLSLAPVLGALRCPFLAVHGKRDGIFPWTDAEKAVAGASGPSELLLYEDGDHCCHNVNHRSKPAAADWLLQKLGAQR
ncbi:MAG: alpha/beta hydrolase [Betaproteobacteria bacterium]